MSMRARTERELDELAAMLPPWLRSLRHEAQFWPQFNVLAQRIIDRARLEDRAHAVQRVEAMLDANGVDSNSRFDFRGRPLDGAGLH